MTDEVQVWLVPDQRSERVLADLLAVLDAGERLRAAACRSDADRRRFVVAHGALRHIVAGRLGVPAAELRWSRGPHGKPELAGRWRGAQVNLSHSGDLAMVAVTGSRRVGVDIQRVLPRLDAVAMARRYFPPEEAAYVQAAPDPQTRADRFAGLWSRKEALVKAHGTRLTAGLRIPVHEPPSPTPAPAVPPPRPADGYGPASWVPGERGGRDGWAGGYRIADVAAPAGYRAAVALSGRADYRVVLLRWSWSDPAP